MVSHGPQEVNMSEHKQLPNIQNSAAKIKLEPVPLEHSRHRLMFCRRDLLLKTLALRFDGNYFNMALFATVLHLILVLGPGAAISYFYQQAGQVFLSLFDTRELILAAYSYLIALPTLWLFYTWQVYGVENAINYLRGVSEGEPSLTNFIESASKEFNKPTYLYLAILIPLTFIFVWLNSLGRNTMDFFGLPGIWWNINRIFFWLIFIPHIFVLGYLAVWMVVRGVLAVWLFRKFFTSYRVLPKPYHYDQANGLASIGNYAIKSTLLSVPFGFWGALLIIYPMFFGNPLYFRVDNFLFLIAYILAVPILLLSPVWAAHKTMYAAKVEVLESIAVKLRGVLSQMEVGTNNSNAEQLEALEKKYRVVEREYKTWPFDYSSVGRLIATTAAPVASVFISYLLDKYP
jgi:hypothetical protein